MGRPRAAPLVLAAGALCGSLLGPAMAAAVDPAHTGATTASIPAALADTARVSPTEPGPRDATPHAADEDLLLLALRLDPFDLDVTLGTWRRRDGLLVPLGGLAQALGIGIEVDPIQHVAQGFVLDPRRGFRLNAGSDVVVVDGTTRSVDPSEIEWHDDDVYVDTRRVSEWLPLDLIVDRRAATLTVRPRERLPVQQRRERERRAARKLAGQTPPAPGPIVRAPYRAWGYPASDHSLYAYRQGQAFGARSGLQYTSLFGGDLLFMEGRGYVAGDDRDPAREVRLSLGRRDPDPVLLGPLRAREFAIGDVLDPGLELVSLASAGKGTLLSSFPLFDENEYDRRTLRGDLPPGWDVELYRNDALIGYRRSGAEGLYEFPDVPLLYGANVFRLQFYGPQGESRTETRIVNLGRSLTPRGRIDYRVIAHASDAAAGSRVRAEISAGLSRQFSATARLARLSLDGRDHLYGGAGLRFGWERVFVKADAIDDTAGGSAAQATVATRIGPRWGLWAQHAWLDRFRSEVFRPLFGDIRSHDAVRADVEPGAADRRPIPTSLEWRRDRLGGGGSVDDVIHQVSAGVRGLRLSNRFQWRFVRLNGASPAPERRGALLVSRGVGNMAVRGVVEYGFERGGELRDLGLVAETSRFGQLLAAGIRRSSLASEHSGYLSVTRPRGRWGMVLRSDYSSVSGGGVSALLSVTLDRDPRSGRWNLDARRGAENGAVSAQVFLDDNGNGRKDPVEEPLEGVRLRSSQSSPEASTGPDGVALLRGLPGGLATDLGLVASSLDDPLRIATRPQVTVLPRAGGAVRVDFPIQLCGEVAGTVSLRRAGVTGPLAGAKLELLTDSGDRLVRSVRTAFDGYYDIAAIPPGRYRLRVTPSGPPRADVAPAIVAVDIGPNGPILEPVDVELIEVTPEIAGQDGPEDDR